MEALAVVEAVDGSAALQLSGVLGVLTAADIPGSNEVYGAPLLAGQGTTAGSSRVAEHLMILNSG
jgi:xanthine dehydrogenase molybdopterin-binding subunit B